jgi:major membrane immunogen (membrane-anchored lipoprotein)
MKKIFTVVTLICLSIVALSFTSCSKKDDPADNDLFVGTYKGKISYLADKDKKSVDNGSVTVVKAGNDYYFRFSDGIPDLKGVSFKKEGDNNLVNVDFQDGLKIIRITASSLYILYTTDGKTWTANAKR